MIPSAAASASSYSPPMAAIAVVISAGSLIIAVVAIVYARRADRRAARQEEREAQRFMSDQEWAELRRTANITTDFGGMRSSPHGRDFRFALHNLGPAPTRRKSCKSTSVAADAQRAH